MVIQKWINGHAIDRYDFTQSNIQIVKKRYYRVIKHLSNGSVIDLGCAYGIGTKLISDRGFEVVGIDFDREVIQMAQRLYPKINFQVKDIEKISLIGYENFVLCDVIQHLSYSKSLLEKWGEQLKDAILIGTTLDPNLMSEDKIDEFSPGLTSPKELKELFPDIILWKNTDEIPNRYWFKVDRVCKDD